MQRVLIVEDSPTMRALLVSALDPLGLKITEAETGFEALRCLSRESFDLLLASSSRPASSCCPSCGRARGTATRR